RGDPGRPPADPRGHRRKRRVHLTTPLGPANCSWPTDASTTSHRSSESPLVGMPLGGVDLAPLAGPVDRLEELPPAADCPLLERGDGHLFVLGVCHQAVV